MQFVFSDTSNVVYSTPCPPIPKLEGQLIIWNKVPHIYHEGWIKIISEEKK